MGKYIQPILILFLLAVIYPANVYSQDTIRHPKKNIIKVNFTAGFVYNFPVLFEYERVLKPHQSFSIQAGYMVLPFETYTDRLILKSNRKQNGFTITGDYRFYLKRENKHAAPHGIYIAPYFSFYHFVNVRDLEFKTDSGALEPLLLDSKFNVLSIGFELGYQFTIGKRLTIDCLLLGPSVSNYNVEMQLTGNLDDDELTDMEQELLQQLADNFPFIGKLMNNEIATFSGKSNSWNYGYRYSIHFGYRF